MAFVNTVVQRWMSDGKCYEKGTWALDGGSTTGTITPELTGHGLNGGIREIYFTTYGSDGNHAVIESFPVGKKNVVLTCTANDTGTYDMNGYLA